MKKVYFFSEPFLFKVILNFQAKPLDTEYKPFVGQLDSYAESVEKMEDEIAVNECVLPFSNFQDYANTELHCDVQTEVTVQTEEYPCKICGK